MTPYVIEIPDAALGAHLGSGMFRDTYEYKPDPANYVVKRGVAFDNLREFETWRDVQSTPALASLFAPVAGISSDHRRLLMRRAIVLRSLPKETYDALHAAQARDVMTQGPALAWVLVGLCLGLVMLTAGAVALLSALPLLGDPGALWSVSQ